MTPAALFADLSAGEAAGIATTATVIIGGILAAVAKAVIDWQKAKHDLNRQTETAVIQEWRELVEEQGRRIGLLEAKGREQDDDIRKLWQAEQECQRKYYRALVWLRHCEEAMRRHGMDFKTFDPGAEPDTPPPPPPAQPPGGGRE